MLKRLLTFSAVYGALSLYWRHSYGYFFTGTDEFFVFSRFARATDMEELIKFLFVPHNSHLAPVFKALFYLQYVLFGTSSTPYHAVSIGLFSASALLLWRFIRDETGDRASAFICTAVYMTTTVYYSVIAWVFLQQFILTFIFIELSLLSAQGSVKKGGGLVLSGICCLLASLCLSFGAAAWLFTAVYFVLKQRALPEENKLPSRRIVPRLLPLAASAGASLIFYYIFLSSLSESYAEKLAIDPLLIAKGIAVMLGDIILDATGAYHVISLLAERAGTPVATLMPALRAAIFASFFSALALALILLVRLKAEYRAAALSGIILSIFSAAIIIGARVSSWDYDVYQVTNIIRYKYFPFFFLLSGTAPYIANAGRRLKATLFILLPLLITLHSLINADMVSRNSERISAIKEVATLVRKSVVHPIIRDKGGKLRMVKATVTDSRYIENIVFFEGQHMHYVDLLHIYKKPGEIITKHNGKLLYLKNHISIAPADVAPEPESAIQLKGDALKASTSENFTLSIKGGGSLKPSPLQHIHLRIKSARPSKGKLHCLSAEGGVESRDFEIRESPLHKRYLLPCPSGSSLRLELGAGDYSVKDIRLYY
jgi:hypothetical protein